MKERESQNNFFRPGVRSWTSSLSISSTKRNLSFRFDPLLGPLSCYIGRLPLLRILTKFFATTRAGDSQVIGVSTKNGLNGTIRLWVVRGGDEGGEVGLEGSKALTVLAAEGCMDDGGDGGLCGCQAIKGGPCCVSGVRADGKVVVSACGTVAVMEGKRGAATVRICMGIVGGMLVCMGIFGGLLVCMGIFYGLCVCVKSDGGPWLMWDDGLGGLKPVATGRETVATTWDAGGRNDDVDAAVASIVGGSGGRVDGGGGWCPEVTIWPPVIGLRRGVKKGDASGSARNQSPYSRASPSSMVWSSATSHSFMRWPTMPQK